ALCSDRHNTVAASHGRLPMLSESRPESAAILEFAGQSPATSQMSASHAAQLAAPTISTPLRQAIFRTQQWLLSQQTAEGYWVAELEGDTILESEFMLLLAYLREENSPLAHKCAQYLLKKQTAEGYWTQYPGGAIDVSASVKAYFALKLTG